jgi:hypothetical protein
LKGSWSRFVFWLAVGLTGHGALLGLMTTGTWSVGLRPPTDALANHRLAVGVVVAVAILVGARARPMAVMLGARYGALRVFGFAAIWTLATTLVARSAGAYAWSLAIVAVSHLANLGAMVLAARAIPPVTTAIRGVVPWGSALAATVVTIVVSQAVFDAIPHVPDDVAYYFQAKTYAAGLPYRVAPPEPELFEQFLIPIENGKWFSVFPPGWPLILAVGMLAGVPWLVNPVLAGLAVLITHSLVRRRVSRAAADVAAVILACSPSFLFVSSTYMAHTLGIACAMGALLGVELAASAATTGIATGWATVAGGAAGLLFLTRPMEGTVVGAVVVARVLGVSGRRLAWSAISAGSVAAAAAISLFFVNNRLLTGSAVRDPIQSYFDTTFYPGSNAFGFGATKGNLGWANNIMPGHGATEAALHANINMALADTELFGWAFGSMLMVVVFAVVVAPTDLRRWLRVANGRLRAPGWLVPWAAIALLTIGASSLYWYSGADLGPRYWLQCIVPFAVLSVISAFAVAERIGCARRRAGALLVVASIFGAAIVIPWRASTKYYQYRGVFDDVQELRSRALGERDLVLIRSRLPGAGGSPFSDFGSAIILNDIPLDSGPIFARASDDASVARLRGRWPSRRVWILDAPSLTKQGFVVVESPGRPQDHGRR